MRKIEEEHVRNEVEVVFQPTVKEMKKLFPPKKHVNPKQMLFIVTEDTEMEKICPSIYIKVFKSVHSAIKRA